MTAPLSENRRRRGHQERIMRAIMRNRNTERTSGDLRHDDKAVALPGHAGFIKNNLRNYGMLLSLFRDHAVLPGHDRRHAAASR